MFTKLKAAATTSKKNTQSSRNTQKRNTRTDDESIEPLLTLSLLAVISARSAHTSLEDGTFDELCEVLAPDLSLSDSENDFIRRAESRWTRKRQEIISNQMLSYFFLLEQCGTIPVLIPDTYTPGLLTRTLKRLVSIARKVKRLLFHPDNVALAT